LLFAHLGLEAEINGDFPSISSTGWLDIVSGSVRTPNHHREWFGHSKNG
jgi:hypothetical protein